MNAPASGDSFTRTAVEVRGRTRNAQLTNELKAGGGKGRMKAMSPSLGDCGCPFSADPQRLYHGTGVVAIKTAPEPGRFGAATAGGCERSSIRMHNRNDTTSTVEELSETRAMSTHVQPRFERVDTGNRKTGRRKSISVHPSTPIYILSRSEEERSGETNLPVKKRFGFWGGRLDIVSQTNRRVGEICVHPQTPRLDEGGHNSGEVIG